MGQKSVTLQLPDELYERVQEAAEASDRPVEKVLVESLDILFRQPVNFAPIDNLLAEMTDYTDAQLWGVVYRQLPWSQSLRWRELNAKGKQSSLTDAENTELEYLIDLVDRSTLLRSEALLLLKQRRQDVATYLT
jgi:predicted transcriptional regulator